MLTSMMTDEEMLRLYTEGKNYEEIGRLAGVDRHVVSRRIRSAGGKSRSPSERRLGEKNPAWKGGRHVTKRGYVMRRIVGEDRYEYEHRLIMEEKLGRSLDTTEQVHHDNEQKGDNRAKNLVLTTKTTHRRDHHQMHGWSLNYARCESCGTTELPHMGRGLCSRCFSADRRGASPTNLPIRRTGRWAKNYDRCRECGTTERRHGGFGLCSGCKAKLWREEHDYAP